MNLYERDYTIILTEEEKEAYEKEMAYASISTVKNNRGFPGFSHPNKEVRDFLWQKRSYFPNNYLHFRKYKEEVDFGVEAEKFAEILSSSVNEQQFQKYIKENRKWFIPGSIFLDYNFGHHDAYLFPEQKLGTDYIADYMLIGKNSDGYSIVLVEFENANTEFILKTENMEAESVRKGLTQIRDWKRWLDSNREFFLRNIGLINQGIDIPTYRIYYYLVVSRREYMNDRATELRSQLMYEMQNLKIVSFDRLVDNVCKLVGYNSW